MASSYVSVGSGINNLPNELLYDILQSFSTKHVLACAPVSRRFHSICVRILHNRLAVAASLGGQVLLLECYPPAQKLTAGNLFCTSLGTPKLDGVLTEGMPEAAQIGFLGSKVYSRFKPQRQGPERRPAPKHPAGDIPGSRTHPSSVSSSSQTQELDGDLVSQEVSLDAHELFTQLIANSMLVKPGPRAGTLLTAVEVCDGTIRVWRDWLAKQAQAGLTKSSVSEPADDPSILWVNTANKAMGIKFRVREKKWKRDNPILFSADEEVAVSYSVDLEELVLKTSHLLFGFEESLLQQENTSSKAVVLGTFG